MGRARNPLASWLNQHPSGLAAESTNPSLPLLVVGAGPAGLAVMAGLHRAGVAYQGVEFHSHVGGIWSQSNPLSSVYDSMQTNTSRQTTHLGPPMPSDWPDYPQSSQACAYLRDFAQSEQLLPKIWCSTRFESAAKTPHGTWNVMLRRGEEPPSQHTFRGIVFATGVHHRERRVIPQPLWDEAQAAGLDVRHSSFYRSAEEFAGKRVLIVGIGNSGSDIADIISRVAQRTILAVRSTPWIVPSMVFGRPSDQVADSTTSWLPHWVQLASFHFIQRLYIGHPSKFGLPAPTYQLMEKLAVTDRGIIKAVRDGRVHLRTNITSLAGGVATFAKPEEAPEPVDAVILATGYNRQYPLLDAPPGASLSDALSFLIFHRTEPGLAYMAETIGTRGCWPIFAEQGRTVAAYFAAEARGGCNVAEFNTRRGLPSPDFKGKYFRKSDGFHVEYKRYTQALGALSEWLEA